MQKSINYWSFPGGLEAKKESRRVFRRGQGRRFPRS